MKRYILWLFIIGMVAGCKPAIVNPSDVISPIKISNSDLVADGTTVVYVSVTLNKEADAGKTSVIFETSGGHFQTTGNVDTLVTQPAAYQTDGSLVATIGWKVPALSGRVIISARPAILPAGKSYIVSSTINFEPSVPTSITLTPSTLNLKSNFGSEVSLIALLSNAQGKNVSINTTAVFQDFLANGQPAGGSFRAVRDSTDATSTAVATYSIGTASLGPITISCKYIDPKGINPTVSGSCIINVTQ